jgi:hypothetical protein
MERRPFLVCDERQRATCKHGPDCDKLQTTEHHIRPRRLEKIAKEVGESAIYLAKLRQVIRHPNNIVIAPRCMHDRLDELTNDERIPESELDSTLEVWNRE